MEASKGFALGLVRLGPASPSKHLQQTTTPATARSASRIYFSPRQHYQPPRLQPKDQVRPTTPQHRRVCSHQYCASSAVIFYHLPTLFLPNASEPLTPRVPFEDDQQWLVEKANPQAERALEARPRVSRAPRSSRAIPSVPVCRYVVSSRLRRHFCVMLKLVTCTWVELVQP
jgi:hypothetical protein